MFITFSALLLFVTVVADITAASLIHAASPPQPSPAPWKLVFEDAFDGTHSSVNSSVWDFEVGYIRNAELQWYDTDSTNVNITDGSLSITATRNQTVLPDGTKPFCRSGSIFTKQSFTYGRFEMRARLPGRAGNGTWPAFWLLGADVHTIGWPMCGEIDIMENVGFDRNELFCTLHDSQNSSMRNNDISNHVSVPSMYTGFNLYAVEWTPDHIEFYVNNVSVLRYNNDQRCRDTSWPYNKPFMMKLNLAIGGGWGGNHGVDLSIFPAQYQVDYVRVFQRVTDVAPACQHTFAYAAFATSVEVDAYRWLVAPDGPTVSAMHLALAADIASLVNVSVNRVHVWAIILSEQSYDRATIVANFSVVDIEPADFERWAHLATDPRRANWTFGFAHAMGRRLPSSPELTTLYFGLFPPWRGGSVPFRVREIHSHSTTVMPVWEFDFGGPEVAYRDVTPWNEFGDVGRSPPETIDIGAGDGGNFAIGYIQATEFVRFSGLRFVNKSCSSATCEVAVRLRYSSGANSPSNCTLVLLDEDTAISSAVVHFAGTGGWGVYVLSDPVMLLSTSDGAVTLRLEFGHSSTFNIESIHVVAV